MGALAGKKNSQPKPEAKHFPHTQTHQTIWNKKKKNRVFQLMNKKNESPTHFRTSDLSSGKIEIYSKWKYCATDTSSFHTLLLENNSNPLESVWKRPVGEIFCKTSMGLWPGHPEGNASTTEVVAPASDCVLWCKSIRLDKHWLMMHLFHSRWLNRPNWTLRSWNSNTRFRLNGTLEIDDFLLDFCFIGKLLRNLICCDQIPKIGKLVKIGKK